MKDLHRMGSGKLSYFENAEVAASLDLTGRHCRNLAVADSESFDRVVLSVLGDLMGGQGDSYRLTQSEAYHLFMLAKICSFGPTLTTSVRCRRMLAPAGGKVQECGALTEVSFSLLESDINYCPHGYEIPAVTVGIGGRGVECLVRPPTMAHELGLITYFQERGVSRADILSGENRGLAMDWANHRMALYLHEKETGNTFHEHSLREEVVKAFDDNPARLIGSILKIIQEQDGFGVSHKRLKATCKECGGDLTFRLPLSAGLPL